MPGPCDYRPVQHPARAYEAALLRLSRLACDEQQSLERLFARASRLIACTLDVERVGIWLFEDGRRLMRCACLYERTADAYPSEATLRPADFPAYAAALEEHPRVNATWREGVVVAQEEINLGIAVAIDEGLVVPVIRGANRMPLPELAARRAELVEAARAGRLAPTDVQGGTFTISNLGMYGVDAFLAVVNAPQAAILAVGRIADRVVAVDGAPAVRPTMTLAFSFDHRVVDGAGGARFVDTVAALVEEPSGLVDR